MYQIELTGINISSIMDRQANLSEDSGLQSLNVRVNACNKKLIGYSEFLKNYKTKTPNTWLPKCKKRKVKKTEKNHIICLNDAISR